MPNSPECLWGPIYTGKNPNSTTYEDALNSPKGQAQIAKCAKCDFTQKSGLENDCKIFWPNLTKQK